jgi:prevent-host-death family protein
MDIDIHAAKTNLSRLIEKASHGDTIVISKAGKPVARLIAYERDQFPVKPGLMKGEIWIADDFDAPLELLTHG